MAVASKGEDGQSFSIGNFVNDSALMIAYERALESRRENALFVDPLAEALSGGDKGEELSLKFGANCAMFGLADWPEFHKQWVAVRTRFIDDFLAEHASSFTQLVNLGAGYDTRAFRLDVLAGCSAFEVDMKAVNEIKARVFSSEELGKPKAKTKARYTVDLDFLDKGKTLRAALEGTDNFGADEPSIFVSEGLIMYLGQTGKLKLLKEVSAAAAKGSLFILQFMEDVANNSPAALGQEEAKKVLGDEGWKDLAFFRFGEDKLSFDRFPNDKFEPVASFSFLTCVKA